MSDGKNTYDEKPSLTGSAGALGPRIKIMVSDDVETRSAGALAPRSETPPPPVDSKPPETQPSDK